MLDPCSTSWPRPSAITSPCLRKHCWVLLKFTNVPFPFLTSQRHVNRHAQLFCFSNRSILKCFLEIPSHPSTCRRPNQFPFAGSSNRWDRRAANQGGGRIPPYRCSFPQRHRLYLLSCACLHALQHLLLASTLSHGCAQSFEHGGLATLQTDNASDNEKRSW